MTSYVTDYAWARPDPHATKAAGFVAVCRYLSHDHSGKTLTPAEVASLHSVGLGIVLNFEDSAGRALAGRAAGYADAMFANALADSLGAPSTVAIYYSVDTDPGSPVREEVKQYVYGLLSAGGRAVGVYGGAVLVQWAFSVGVTFGWTANASSWNHGVAPNGHLHQLYGHPAGTPLIAGVSPGDYDTSEILNPNFGAWGGTTGGFSVTAEQQIQVIYDNLMGGKGHSLLQDIENMVAALPKPPTANQIATAVVAKLPAGQVDVATLAKAIVKAEGEALLAAV